MLASARRRIQEFAFPGRQIDAAEDRLTLTHVALIAACLLALFVFAQSVEVALRLRTPLPYYEEWSAVADYGKLRSGDFGPSDWFAQYQEHRPAVPRLFIFGDYYLLGGQHYLQTVVNAGLQFIEAALLAGGAFFLFRGRRGGAALLVLCAAASLALQFTSAQVETFIVPFQVLWTIGFTAGTAALAAFACARSFEHPRRRTAFLAAAIVLAAIAQFSVAHGGWAWLLLLVMAWRTRAPRSWLIAIGVAAAVCLAFYFYGFTRAPEYEDPVESVQRPDRLADFVLVMVGSPMLPLLGNWVARIAGLVGVAAAIAVMVDASRRRHAYGGAAAFLAAQIVFSMLTIVTIALGRAPLGVEAAEAPRYCMLAATLWTALIMLSWHAAPAFPVPVYLERFGAAAAGVMIVVAAASPWQAVPPWERVFTDLDQAESAILAGVYDDSAIVHIYPVPGEIKELIPILDEYDISVFQDDELGGLIGTRLEDEYGIAEGLCRGFFDASLDARSPVGAAVSGWAWDPNRKVRPATILIAGPDGVIRGFATSFEDRVDVIGTVREVTTLNTGWFGYSHATDGPARAYAVVADDVVCPLDGEHEVVVTSG